MSKTEVHLPQWNEGGRVTGTRLRTGVGWALVVC